MTYVNPSRFGQNREARADGSPGKSSLGRGLYSLINQVFRRQHGTRCCLDLISDPVLVPVQAVGLRFIKAL